MGVKWFMMSAATAGVAGIGYGVMPSGQVYPLSKPAVEMKLRSMDLEDRLGVHSSKASISISEVTDEGMTWEVREGGQTLGWFEANLKEVDEDHTRVAVDFEMSDLARSANRDELVGEQAMMRAAGRAAMQQAIASTLADEPPSFSRSYGDDPAAGIAASRPEATARAREYQTQDRMRDASRPVLDPTPRVDRYR
jgi:hypothetical protein